MRSARRLVTKQGRSKYRELKMPVPSTGDTGENIFTILKSIDKTQRGSYMLGILVIFSYIS